MFRQVTDMAWNAAGDTFISDGYINSRVAKYDKNGKWVKSFGEPGSGPGQLNTPHSIATDAQGNVYVANRGNSRIEVFDGDGKYLRKIKISEPFDYANTVPIIGNKPPVDLVGTMGPGAPWTVCITPGPNQVLYASDAFPGRVYKISLDGKVLGKLGGDRQASEAIRLDPRNRLPLRERNLRGRVAELARAETHAASGEVILLRYFS